MRASTTVLLFAATALAAPAPKSVAQRDATVVQGTAGLDPSVFDQGDGFYMASFNESTASLDVSFTPVAELSEKSTAVTSPNKRSAFDLKKRDTTCPGWVSNDVPSLDAANVRLADNVNDKTFGFMQWGWVRCSYVLCHLYIALIACSNILGPQQWRDILLVQLGS